MSIASLIPMPWRVTMIVGLLAVLGAVSGFAAWKGYESGYEKATALGRAELAKVQLAHETAYSEAMREANRKLQAQARNALVASQALESERTNNARQQSNLRSQIASITRGSSHTFSADFVRMFNAAIGASGYTMPAAAGAGRADGASGAGSTTGSGVLAAVTEADVLAFIAYYGERTKNLEAQINAWIDLAEGWE